MNRFSDCAWSMKGARSPANSSSQRWSISKLVLKVAFSSVVRKSRCWTLPPRSRIEFQTLVEFLLFLSRIFSR